MYGYASRHELTSDIVHDGALSHNSLYNAVCSRNHGTSGYSCLDFWLELMVYSSCLHTADQGRTCIPFLVVV